MIKKYILVQIFAMWKTEDCFIIKGKYDSSEEAGIEKAKMSNPENYIIIETWE